MVSNVARLCGLTPTAFGKHVGGGAPRYEELGCPND